MSLIDNGYALNLCTLRFVTQVGYIVVDMHNQCITIMAYDNVERSSTWMINLPLQVGVVTQTILCHIVDLDLSFNILLGRQWIHTMQVVPSTYHQCLKFSFQGCEITICGDTQPFEYYCALEASSPYAYHCLGINMETSH